MVEKKEMNLPADMVEEILLNLPVKSLLRFSSVSKTWKSMISESGFIKRYRSRATLPGRERVVLRFFNFDKESLTARTCALSSLSSSVNATEFVVCPFSNFEPSIFAFCDELWLARVDNLLFLWNPSMRAYKKLPKPSIMPRPSNIGSFIYGLGYDSIGDDYKILKIPLVGFEVTHCCAELYSLRSDSWKEIPNFPRDIIRCLIRCRTNAFVSGNLHWMSSERADIIISFDLSTEKFGEMAKPNYSPSPSLKVNLTALRGMLCLTLDYSFNYSTMNVEDTKFVIWVMEDYGVATSWTMIFSITFLDSFAIHLSPIRPVYLYQNGDILINTWNSIFVYKGEKTIPQRVKYSSICGYNDGIGCRVVYAESLVAPAMWSR